MISSAELASTQERSAGGGAKSKPTGRVDLYVALALVGFCLVTYANTLPAYFGGDEFGLLKFVHSFKQVGSGILWDIFATPLRETQPTLHSYRPLPNFVFLLEYLAFGINSVLYHAASVCLHAGTAYLLWLIGRRMFEGAGVRAPYMVAFLAAALFAVCPIGAEAVYSPINIIVLTCAVFTFASIQLYLMWTATGRRRLRALSLLCCACAMLSKEPAAAIPLILMLCDLLVQRHTFKESLLRALPFWLVLIGYLLLRTAVLGPGFGGYHSHAAKLLADSWQIRLLGPWPIACLFPFDPYVWKDNLLLRAGFATIYGALALLFVVHAKSYLSPPRARLLLTLLGWTVLLALPCLPAFSLGPNLVGGRHLYFALGPLFLAVVLSTSAPAARRLSLTLWFALAVGFAAVCAFNNAAYVDGAQVLQQFQRSVVEEAARTARDIKIVVLNPPRMVSGIVVLEASRMFINMFSEPVTAPAMADRVELAKPWYSHDEPEVGNARLAQLSNPNRYNLLLWNGVAQRLEPFHGAFGDGKLQEELEPADVHRDQTNNISELTYVVEPDWMRGEAGILEFDLASTPALGYLPVAPPAVSLCCQPGGATIALPVQTGGRHRYAFLLNQTAQQIHNRGTVDYIQLLLPSPGFENRITNVRLLGWRLSPTGNHFGQIELR